MSTISDVSKRAGVSKSTVSNVFNNKKYVSEKVREKVLRAAKELNYYPNKRALSLANNKTNMIGLFLENFGEFRNMHRQIVEGIAIKLNEENYNLILYLDSVGKDVPPGMRLRAEPIDGAIILDPAILDSRIRELVSSGTPIVLVGRAPQEYNNLCSLDVNNVEIAYQATKLLLEHGHEKIAMINSASNLTITADRLKGYVKAHTEAGIEFEPSLVYNCNNTKDKGRELAKRVMDTRSATAIITESDVVAAGVYEEAKVQGIQIPQDLSVFALGGTDESLTPEVGKVVVDYKKIGTHAAEKIFKIINQEAFESNTELEAYQMIKAKSVDHKK